MECPNPRNTWRGLRWPIWPIICRRELCKLASSAWPVGSRSSGGRRQRSFHRLMAGISFPVRRNSRLRPACCQTLDSRSPQPSKPWELPVAAAGSGRRWRLTHQDRRSIHPNAPNVHPVDLKRGWCSQRFIPSQAAVDRFWRLLAFSDLPRWVTVEHFGRERGRPRSRRHSFPPGGQRCTARRMGPGWPRSCPGSRVEHAGATTTITRTTRSPSQEQSMWASTRPERACQWSSWFPVAHGHRGRSPLGRYNSGRGPRGAAGATQGRAA
jgi:hypothetical protein